MSVEPGLIDANVLVYALDADAPQHASSRTLLDAGRSGSTTLYVTSQILCEFYSVVTNPRRVTKPRSTADAIAAISGMVPERREEVVELALKALVSGTIASGMTGAVVGLLPPL